MTLKILLVEDEQLVGTMVELNLQQDGYAVTWKTDGLSAWDLLQGTRFDLILLDIALPGIDGIELLSRIRRHEIGTPVLMLTARADVKTKVETFDLGADDYLPKPFELPELLARVKALLRRSQADREMPSDQELRIGQYQVSLTTREAISNEGTTTLSEKEAATLALLVKTAGEVLRRSDILDEVWGMDATPTERTVDNVILKLRKLFEPDPETPRHFITVRGIGYRFIP